MKIANALHYSLRWLYKSIAIFLVVFAVLLSCLRLLLPHAHHYRDDVQNYINTTYQTNIIIGSLNTGWAASGPTLLARNISLLNANGVEIFVGNFEVELDFWQTLINRQLVTTNFTMERAKVFINPSLLDKNDEKDKQNIVIERLSELFLKQIPQFTVKNSQLQIQFSKSQKSFSITELAWLNKGKSHKAKGDVIVDGLSTNKLKLLVDLNGNDKSSLTGQAYFEANSINITPWLDSFLVIEDEKTDSSINFQTWLNIENGRAQQLLVKFGENRLTWHDKPLVDNNIIADVIASTTENNDIADEASYDNNNGLLQISDGYIVINSAKNFDTFSYYSSPINWQVNDLPTHKLNIQGVIADNYIDGSIDKLDIKSLRTLGPLFVADPEFQSQLLEIDPVGELSNLQFEYLNTVKFNTEFNGITTNNYGAIPGGENLSGNIAYHKNLLVSLASQQGIFDFGKHFRWPISYNNLQADILLSFSDGVLAKISDIKLISDELSLTGNAVVTVPNDEPASMALLAYVDNGKAEFAKHYYPHLLMGDNLVRYLDRAITNGTMHDTEIGFDGHFKDFPFTDKPGIFYVDANISEGDFVFDSDWPAIEKLNANLNFTKNSMLITARSGSLTGLDVNGVEVAIDDLSDKQVLTVDAIIEQQSPEHIAKLMNASSFASSVGSVLNTAVFIKPVSGDFSLNLPLNDIDNTVAKGSIKFSNNDLHLQSPNMLFSNLYGELTFNNDKVSVTNVNGNWRGMPMSFSVNAENENSQYITSLNLSGHWKKELWQIELPEPMQKYVDGEISWFGDLMLSFPNGGGMSYQLGLTADLIENQLNLPEPYLKTAQQEAKLTANIYGNEEQSTIEANLNENLSFFGELLHQEAVFKKAHLVLGEETMMLPVDGFHISAMVDYASIEQWQPLLSDILLSLPESNESADTVPLLSKPERIRGTVKSVNAFGEMFNDVSFNMSDKNFWWLLDVNAKEIRSQIKLYPNLEEQGLDINIDFLNLADKSLEEPFDDLTVDVGEVNEQLTAAPEKPKVIIDHAANKKLFDAMPPLKLACGSCKFGKFDFGQVNFEVAKENEQLLLKNFIAKRKGLVMKIDGQWLMEEDYSSTQLSGELKIKKIEAEMDRLGFDSIIKDSGAEMNFELNWPGSLGDFGTNDLNGYVNSEIDDGYLADVPDQARVFSILSLQSIVRKFALDFRDIFSDGMFYQSIKGKATIEKGIVYTDNLEMDGSAGFLSAKGNTNLVNGGLDYRITYKPNLTSSLPALAWIATLNPVAIIAGFAIDEVITTNVVSEYTFELTGSVENSDLKEVNRKNKNISVGRSSPPVEVKDQPSNGGSSTEPQITPLKQYAPIYENNDG